MGAPTEFDDQVMLPDVRTLAEQLHDGLSQQLFAAELDLHELRGRTDLPDDARVVLDRLGDRLTMGARQLREALMSVFAAGEGPVRATTVTDAVHELAEAFAAAQPAVATTVEITGEGPEPDRSACRVLARTVREGLANVAKHAGAERVRVVLRRSEGEWTVEVHDDGCGDPVELRAAAEQLRSFGLYSLMSDAAQVGGRLAITASPQLRGIRLAVTVPVTPTATRR
jgi:signal transduction histidine kinase